MHIKPTLRIAQRENILVGSVHMDLAGDIAGNQHLIEFNDRAVWVRLIGRHVFGLAKG